eukprot:2674033-Prymnesium_polylepis.1
MWAVEAEGARRVATLERAHTGRTGAVFALALSADGRFLFSSDETFKAWTTEEAGGDRLSS